MIFLEYMIKKPEKQACCLSGFVQMIYTLNRISP